jgi:peptidoglycan/LPS O-acetylase OafA/YrhL
MNTAPLFVNHYQTKLQLDNPFFDVFLVAGLIVLFLSTLRKSVNDNTLSFLQTNQLKGLAIILILFNHLCYYTEPSPSLYGVWSEAGMVGVAIFLIISGYGLSISMQQKGIEGFFLKRASRILIPLIFALGLLLLLKILLEGTEQNILIEIPRILFFMHSLDGKTWFIIFILFWYCLLYLTFKFALSNQNKLIFLFLVSLVIISIPQTLHLAKANAFSFPFGCWMGLNSSFIKGNFNKLLEQKILILISFLIGSVLLSALLFNASEIFHFRAYSASLSILILAVILSSFYIFYLGFFRKIKFNLSSELIAGTLVVSILYLNYLSMVFDLAIEEPFNIYWCFVRNLFHILISLTLLLLISLMTKFKVYSLFLSFLGNISFELFLTHNTFLIHFDFILFRWPVAITFVIYFLLVCSLSLVLKRLSAKTLSAMSTAYQK